MSNMKEKRAFERIDMPDLCGAVEFLEALKPVSIVNASEEGICICGADFPVGSVVRLAIDPVEDVMNISLYCKVVWASREQGPEKKSGLLFLNTNKVLFRKDLLSFTKLVDSAKKQANS